MECALVVFEIWDIYQQVKKRVIDAVNKVVNKSNS